MIEEDRPSQAPTRNRGEDIEEASDEDEQPRRPVTKKGKKGKSKARARPEEEDETTLVGEPPEDEEDPLATLGEQPLDHTQSGKIKGLADDWASPAQQHASWYGAVNDLGSMFAEFIEDDEKGQQVRAPAGFSIVMLTH